MSEVASREVSTELQQGQAFPIEKVLGAIIAAAENPAVDVAKMQGLFALQKELLVMQAEAEFNRALMRLPAIHVRKNGVVSLGEKKGSYKFARWEDMAAVIEPLLQAEGFRLLFDAEPRPGDGGGLIVRGTLLHRDGHSRTASVPLPLDSGAGRNNTQAMGSSLSYGKRYATEMLLNIVRDGDDDDGKRAGTKMISPDQADELRQWAKDLGRDEGAFIHQMFGGGEDAPRSFDEIEEGNGYLAARNTLKLLRDRKATSKA